MFDDRRLPFEVYDELMGMLMHGCVGELIGPKLGIPGKEKLTLMPQM